MLKNFRLKIICFVFSLCMLFGNAFCQDKAAYLHQLNTLLINTVMVDFFPPPIACRIYAYPNIAYYECIRMEDSSLPSFSNKLNGLGGLPKSGSMARPDNYVSAALAFSFVAQNLVGSEYKIENWRKSYMDSLRNVGYDSMQLNNSLQFAKAIADSIYSWAKQDNYNQSRGLPRFTYTNKAGTWRPTPADYAQAIEPHWNTIRPFTLNSAGQFSPTRKLKYSMKKNSSFYKTMMELYTLTNNLDSTQKLIARYWDDNPNVSVNLGHLNYFIHKISPGGHWLMITKQACEIKQESAARSSLAYTLTSIALMDAFIGCWDEKFKTNLIRPITVINDYVNKNWQPYIQTPSFPEFTSGHAVISNAAATVLTNLFGEGFAFADNTEVAFGNEVRKFTSFYAASREVSWSRVYAGIHYPETARISIEQGKIIGKHVLKLLYPNETK
ncbi:MAG: vanadium-dependent haloperoxidase [Ferruginibacter sp.]